MHKVRYNAAIPTVPEDGGRQVRSTMFQHPTSLEDLTPKQLKSVRHNFRQVGDMFYERSKEERFGPKPPGPIAFVVAWIIRLTLIGVIAGGIIWGLVAFVKFCWTHS